MDKKAIQHKHNKLLTHINKKFELGFEKITFKDSVFLLGVLYGKSVWIYMDSSQLKIEESHYMKGARYKRAQQMKPFELTDEKYHEVEKLVADYLYSLKKKQKAFEIKQIFAPPLQKQANINWNMIRFLKYVVNITVEEVYGDPHQAIRKIADWMAETSYAREESFIPLLQGIEVHKSYLPIKTKGTEQETRYSVLKTASNKVIYRDVTSNVLYVFETEKDFAHFALQKETGKKQI